MGIHHDDYEFVVDEDPIFSDAETWQHSMQNPINNPNMKPQVYDDMYAYQPPEDLPFEIPDHHKSTNGHVAPHPDAFQFHPNLRPWDFKYIDYPGSANQPAKKCLTG